MHPHWVKAVVTASILSTGFLLTLAFSGAFAVDHQRSAFDWILTIFFLPYIVLPVIVSDFLWPASREALWSRALGCFTFSLVASLFYVFGFMKFIKWARSWKRAAA